MASKKNALQPALILMYGITDHKYRALDRDAIIVGRARGCDIGLEAPDISNLHCVITRGIGGFQVRDCTSRAGTRLNGDSVTEAVLHDGDVLQMGPFSFRVQLPPDKMPGSAVEARLRHLARSRSKLGRLALDYRRRLKGQRPSIQPEHADHELEQQASALRKQTEQLQERRKQLDELAQKLAQREQDLARQQPDRRAEPMQPDRSLTAAHDLLGQQQEAFDQFENALGRQRQELASLLADLQRLQEQPATTAPEQDLTSDIEELRAENRLLRQMLEERDALVDQLRQKQEPGEEPRQEVQQPAAAGIDIETYEAELNQYRMQLEADRRKLTAEIDQLRTRNQELDEATREAEMELSRERAELARERTRLERLRDDVKAEMDRVQRDAGVRQSLASVQRLRDEARAARNHPPGQPSSKT